MNEGPVVIVTGAGSGIGRATCRTLAARGCRLVLVGRREGPLRETVESAGLPPIEPTQAMVVPADIADPDACGRIVAASLEQFGRADALINNAGLAEFVPVAKVKPDDYERLFAVNLFGPMNLIAAIWPAMIGQGGGTIVNVSSMSVVAPFPGLGVYGAAKAGLETLTRAIAGEGGEADIRAYAVAPGAVETPMLRHLFSTSILPSSQTLDVRTVAEVITACVVGERDEPSGSTIRLPGTG